MTIRAFFLILRRQFTQKWGRFLLASAGIMIGVWAILLTTGLSLGLSDTIIKAINSQPAARLINVYKLDNNKTSFFELDGPPKFVYLAPSEVQKLQTQNPEILEIVPSEIINVYIHTNKADAQTNCAVLKQPQVAGKVDTAPQSAVMVEPALDSESIANAREKCLDTIIFSGVFENFYQTNRTNWYGQTSAPKKGEIASCFRCGGLELNEKLGVSNPKDMIGKTLKLEIYQAPEVSKPGSIFDVTEPDRQSKKINPTQVVELKIVSVVDDRNSSGFSLGGGSSNNFFLDFSYFEDAVKQADPNQDMNNIGFYEYIVFLKDYNDLSKVSSNIRSAGYVSFSLVEGVVSGVRVAFLVLAAVLGAFGFIALIASLFGIVNVMIISVLERQKQIGVLKALGARDTDIFNLFLLESSILGVFGWVFGTIAAYLTGALINLTFQLFLNNNSSFKENLNNLSIDNFSPNFPWWIFLTTFLISILFTSLAGVYPAIKAARQNPVDVLRNE